MNNKQRISNTHIIHTTLFYFKCKDVFNMYFQIINLWFNASPSKEASLTHSIFCLFLTIPKYKQNLS